MPDNWTNKNQKLYWTFYVQILLSTLKNEERTTLA